MKKPINLWAFPYPQQMTLFECFELARDAGFDAVEVNYTLEGDLSPEASESQLTEIGRRARQTGIEISGACSFLYWPYSLTSNDPQRRRRGLELARQMIQAAKALGTENLLVVPGVEGVQKRCRGAATSGITESTAPPHFLSTANSLLAQCDKLNQENINQENTAFSPLTP